LQHNTSYENANVFYELGYAHAKDKLCILLTQNANDIPFDLKHRQHVVYGESISYLKTELTKVLNWAKSEIKAQEQIKIRVESKGPRSLSENLIFSGHKIKQ